MEPVERVKRPLKEMLLQNFLGGIAWGLGVTVGLSVILAILGLVLSQVNLVPFIGGFVAEIQSFLEQNPKISP